MLGLATATVVRCVVGAVAMVWVCPEGLVRPRPSWRLIKPLVGFGIRFQAVDANWVLRDQALNASVGAISGLGTLGLWVLARRLLEVPFLIFQSLWRVSFPTMSRLLADKEDVAPLVERAVGIAAVGTGFVLSGLTGSAAGLVPGLFGEQWRGASVILPGACLGLLISGCVSVATQGYLFAVGDATSVLRSGLLQTAACFAVTLPLLPVLGAVAIGIGCCAGSVAEAVVLTRATSRRIPVRLLRPLLAPVVVAVCSAAVGWAVDVREGATLWSGVLGGGCAVMLFAVGLALSDRRRLSGTFRFAAEAVRAAASRRQPVEAGGPSGG